MTRLLVPAATAAVLLLVVWGNREPYPTQDGPAHLYNASLLLLLSSPAAGDTAVARVYETRPEYTTSLPGHLVLATLLRAVGPAHAENLLISVYGLALIGVLAFATASGRYARPAQCLALPLALNLCLDMGFYNFCLALPCVLLVIAWWARDSPHGRGLAAALVALLATLLHPAAGMIMAGTVGAVEVCSILFFGRAWRSALASILPLLPAGLLLAWQIAGGAGDAITWHDPRARMAETLVPLTLFHGSNLSLLVATGIGAVLWFDTAVRLRQWRALDRSEARWLAAAAAVLAGVFIAPDEAAGGGYIGLRLNTILFLVLLCAFGSSRMERTGGRVIGTVSLCLTLVSIAVLLSAARAQHGRFSALDRLARLLADGVVVLGVGAGEWLPNGPAPLVPPYARPGVHAPLYAGVGRDLALLANYEARRTYFPVRYREGMSPYGTILHPDDDEWRVPALAPVAPDGRCAADALLWERWRDPATRRAFSGKTLDLIARHYDEVGDEGPYTLLRCRTE